MPRKFKRTPPVWTLPALPFRIPKIRLGMFGKIAIALVATSILSVLWLLSREAVEDARTQAYDVAMAHELAAPFLPRFGLKSLNDDGKVEREDGGLVFNGTGIDNAGKSRRVTLHFRSVKLERTIEVGISRIAIDGQEVFRARQH